MLLRLVLVAIGLIEVLAPRQMTDFWMNLATEPGDEAVLRPWIYTVVRLEGFVILLWALRHRHARGATQ